MNKPPLHSEPKELKACPFCGGVAVFRNSERVIQCSVCFIFTNGGLYANPIASWNRRAPSPAFDAMLAALKKMEKAWSEYRQHGSDGDSAVECCEEHFDAVDAAGLESSAALAIAESVKGAERE